jgi:hypothetical protein
MSYHKVLTTLLVILPCWTAAFLIQPMGGTVLSSSKHGVAVVGGIRSLKNHPYSRENMLKMAEGEEESTDDGAPKRKRKRKRKVEGAAAAKAPAPADTIELKPRDDIPVQMEVMNIFSNDSSSQTAVAASSTRSPSPSNGLVSPSAPDGSSSSVDDSLKQLLEDAKMMQELQDGDGEEESENSSVKAKIGKALSTLVTADFFLVCAFLLWFLAGIFCSSILKDDTVQIAFNSK